MSRLSMLSFLLLSFLHAAAAGGGNEQVFHDLEYLLLIWGGVYVSNLLSHYTNLTNILFHIVFGCIMVNAKVLPEHPSQFLSTFSELAITIIMFSLGLEEDVKNFMIGIRKAWGIALIGAMGPFCVGYIGILLFFNDQKMALMSGLCLTATAVSLTMVSLKTYGLSNSSASIGVMTSAVLDDIGSLALVAIMVPILTSSDGVNGVDIVIILSKAIGFFGLVAVICKFIFPERIRLNFCGKPDSFVSKPGLRHLMRVDRHQSTLLVLFIGLAFGMLAHQLGFHPGIGAYMGALIIKKSFFLDYHDKEPDELGEAHRAKLNLAEDTDSFEAVSHAIDNIAMTWMGPVFFVLLGTKLVIDPSTLADSILAIVVIYISMVIIQFLTAAVAARYVPGGFNFVESVMIGLGMLGRAELAFVVLDIAYVQNAIMDQKCFYVLMITCFLLNLTVPCVIAWWRPYYTGEKFLACMMSGPEPGEMGVTGAHGAEIHTTSRGRTLLRYSKAPVVHSFKFMVAPNGAIIAASDGAVKFWGFRHEQDLVGVHRINGRFPDDPLVKGFDLTAEAQKDWPSSGVKELEVQVVNTSSKLMKYTASVRRMAVEGSVFQDSITLRNQDWIFSVHLQDEEAVSQEALRISDSASAAEWPRQTTEHAVIVEMEELTVEKDGTLDWHETARFRKGLEQDVHVDAEDHEYFDKAHMGTISVHSLLELMDWIKRGVSMFDSAAKSMDELCDELEASLVDQDVVNEEKAKEVVATMKLHHHHATVRKKEKKEGEAASPETQMDRDQAMHRCGCDVLVGKVDFLKHPVTAFIRLDEPRDLGELTTEGLFPTKFIFLCLGPKGHQSEDDYHEVGRAFSCLMSNKGFLDIVSEAPSKQIVCEAIHTFLAQSDIIPQFHHVRFGTGNEAGPVADSDSDDEQGVEIVLAKRGTDEQLMTMPRERLPSVVHPKGPKTPTDSASHAVTVAEGNDDTLVELDHVLASVGSVGENNPPGAAEDVPAGTQTS